MEKKIKIYVCCPIDNLEMEQTYLSHLGKYVQKYEVVFFQNFADLIEALKKEQPKIVVVVDIMFYGKSAIGFGEAEIVAQKILDDLGNKTTSLFSMKNDVEDNDQAFANVFGHIKGSFMYRAYYNFNGYTLIEMLNDLVEACS